MLMHEYMDVLMLLVMLILHVSNAYMNILMLLLMLILHVSIWIYEYINVVINVSIAC